ncbi:FMN-dependent NADH-azoreductase [Salinivibrio kushneri]|uniref:FMN dependent NADH:quinone oxidoreductase n=1 Tax=Salinivibrio kushneri TaxID=1908198 RepID=A0AB36K610_9GAMM|nr:FMN-dependent NADH-azoreductase [Salinivibrio kushneri]OOE34114.1 FMN-dependent NADH-azoreductase [Salinivibrio kushneri]OOE44360.1 FMN-dependent NADH-azoreductase [Salinivibrio kushneri]OOE47547.1 FMN-dependent NADH-azoreductase [Salinivibrio kushneri]
MKALVLKSSILGPYSSSNAVINSVVDELSPDTLIERDLASTPLPVLTGDNVGGLRGADGLTDAQQQLQQASDQLIEEIQQSDTLVIAAPMYNFTIPVQLKAWIDLVARAGVTFRYTENGPEGLLQGKRAIVVTTRGGMHKGGATDHVTGYMQTVLGFIGITDVEFVYAEGLAMGEDTASQAIDEAKQTLKRLAS